MRRWGLIAMILPGLALLAGRAAGAAGFEGVWKLTPTAPPAAASEPPREAVLTLKQDGEKITGTVTANGREWPIRDGSARGNELQLKLTVEEDGESRTVTVRATRDGDSLKGTVEREGRAPIAVTGTRRPDGGIAGTWIFTIMTTDRVHKPTVILVLQSEKLTGTLRTDDGAEHPLLSGSVQGTMFRFEIEITVDGQQLRPLFEGEPTEKGLQGRVTVGDESFTWTGERAAPSAPAAK
jgi:hypothetical protein